MDDEKKNATPDREVIDLKEAEAANYWTDKFDITKAKLRAAVNAVGNRPKDVEVYLKRKK